MLKNLAIITTAAFAVVLGAGGIFPSQAAEATGQGASGLPLPRFVSLKSGQVNLRIGPGRDYAVSWRYVKPGLPVEIVQEYDNWRRIRDSEGTEGWVYQSLLSGKRTAIAAPWNKGETEKLVALRSEAADGAVAVAAMEPGVLTKIDTCNGDWCHVEADGASGYVKQIEIWGAYPGEVVED